VGDVFLSLRGRVLVNAEALSAAAASCGYLRRRRVLAIGLGVRAVLLVPSVGGELIELGYRMVLAEVARGRGLPLCGLCGRWLFPAGLDDSSFRCAFGAEPPSSDLELERAVVSRCVVEDVVGFLYSAGGRRLRRVGNLRVGCMTPAAEALSAARRTSGAGPHPTSADLYTLSIDLDTKFIGRVTLDAERVGEPVASDAVERKVAALDALAELLIALSTGASRTRFFPILGWESAVVAVSDDVWTVPSPMSRRYIQRAESKRRLVDYNTELFVYDPSRGGSPEEVLLAAVEEAKRRVRG